MNAHPTKAQARRLAELWASESRSLAVMVEAPEPRDVYNDATAMALKRRGWIIPDGYGPRELPRQVPGYRYEGYQLSFAGMVALHAFIGREIDLSREAA